MHILAGSLAKNKAKKVFILKKPLKANKVFKIKVVLRESCKTKANKLF